MRNNAVVQHTPHFPDSHYALWIKRTDRPDYIIAFPPGTSWMEAVLLDMTFGSQSENRNIVMLPEGDREIVLRYWDVASDSWRMVEVPMLPDDETISMLRR